MAEPKNINTNYRTSNRSNSNRREAAALGFDKIQPQARDLEEAVLGGMMLDREAVAEVVEILKPESFYVAAHGHIFEAIHNLFGRSEPVDILTVTAELRKMGKLEEVGGPFAITQLTNRVGSTANIEYHARIVSEKYIFRELIRTSNAVIKDAFDETTDVFDLLDKTEQNLFDITERNLRRSYEQMGSLVSQVIKQQEEGLEHQDGLTGVPSGFTELDRLTSGWQPSDLVILAARPAMGKTAFVLTMARNAAVDFNRPIAVFSLEMSAAQLATRLIASESGIASERFKRRDMQGHEIVELAAKLDRLSEAKIFIDDTPAINIFELRAKCRRLKMQHDIQMVIIDYLQLMSGGGSNKSGNREQEISSISRALKSIAKELNVPVIALSQLSRAVETRGGDKRPQLSDLRESGAIEQDADMVLFLYRPEYYGFDQDNEGSTKGISEVIVAKHRNGALDTVKLRFVPQFAKFENLNSFSDTVQGLTPLNDLGGTIDGGVMTLGSKMNGDHSNTPDELPPLPPLDPMGGDDVPF